MRSSRNGPFEIDVDDIDPSLLDDPGWQEAMRAAQSPERDRPRIQRVSPSESAGASNFASSRFYLNGGLSDDEDLNLSLEITSLPPSRTSSGNNLVPQTTGELLGRSERTNPSVTRVSRPTTASTTPSVPLRSSSTVFVDSDDEVLILEDVPIPTFSSAFPSPAVPPTPSAPPTIDLDFEYALQLQRELDQGGTNHSVEILDFPDDIHDAPRMPVLPTEAPLPNYNIDRHRTRANQPRSNAPDGPLRGAFGVVSRHGSSSHEPFVPHSKVTGRAASRGNAKASGNLERAQSSPFAMSSPLQTPTPYGSRGQPTRPALPPRALPPIPRASTTPLSPAHLPATTPTMRHRPTAKNSAARSESNVSIGARRNAFPTSVDTRAPEVRSARFTIDSDDDEDEARLRSGVATRRRPERMETRTNGPLSEMGLDVFSLVNRRPPRSGSGSMSLEDIDRAYAMSLEEELWTEHAIFDELPHPMRLQLPNPHQRRVNGRRRGNLGDGFEIDTNDYEAMLQLSERNVKRGASPSLVKSLPVVKASNEDCTICQGTAETAMVALPCLHNFHKECILPHLKSNRFCPNCRHEIE